MRLCFPKETQLVVHFLPYLLWHKASARGSVVFWDICLSAANFWIISCLTVLVLEHITFLVFCLLRLQAITVPQEGKSIVESILTEGSGTVLAWERRMRQRGSLDINCSKPGLCQGATTLQPGTELCMGVPGRSHERTQVCLRQLCLSRRNSNRVISFCFWSLLEQEERISLERKCSGRRSE